MEWISVLRIALLAAVGVIVLIIVKEIVKFVAEAGKNKDWGKIYKLAFTLIEEAEHNFEKGSDKKEWVMNMLRTASDEVGAEFNEDQLSELIDNIIKLTKVVNVGNVLKK